MYTEQELIAGCKKQSQKYQKALYDRFSARMFVLCLRYASDRMQAEDFLQEGFIKVFTRLEQFSGEGSLEGWIRRIMVNTSLEHLRRERLKLADIDFDDDKQVVKQGEGEDVISDLAASELMELINSLPKGYRLVFNLFVFEEYSHKDIAKELGISEGTSKSQLARARVLLQKMVKGNERSWNEKYERPRITG